MERRSALVSGSELGESRLWPTAAILAAAALYATLPSRFIVGPAAGAFSLARWVVPILTILLLLVLMLSAPRGRRGLRGLDLRARIDRRALALAVTALVSAANGVSVALLVHLLANGGRARANPLLRAGIHMWCLNVLVFALWFWELDGGGPVARMTAGARSRDFLFPQQADPSVAEPAWRPYFLDYLYLSFTNATAFSPTDAMPLSRWAKMLMLVEAAASLVLALMVAARAVNILK
jgi:hypothetical protein